MRGFGWIFELIAVLVIMYFAFLWLPRLFAQISASNAAINSAYNPNAAWNRVQADWINSAGNVGTGLINFGAESLFSGIGG
jgi:hypothetical protein